MERNMSEERTTKCLEPGENVSKLLERRIADAAQTTSDQATFEKAIHPSLRLTLRVAPQKMPINIGSARVHGYRGVRESLPPFLILIFLSIVIVPPLHSAQLIEAEHRSKQIKANKVNQSGNFSASHFSANVPSVCAI